MMKKTMIISSALFAGMVAMNGYATEAGKFEKMDTNADGMISADEAQGNAVLVESWTAVDTNQDGQLDAAEFSAFEMTTTKTPSAE